MSMLIAESQIFGAHNQSLQMSCNFALAPYGFYVYLSSKENLTKNGPFSKNR